MCLRLRQAGVFLKLRDTALLRPGDILAQLGELPHGEGGAEGGDTKAQARLAEVQDTLGMLGEQKAALERRARRCARRAPCPPHPTPPHPTPPHPTPCGGMAPPPGSC